MLCYAMLCYANAMLCFAMLCYAMRFYAMLCSDSGMCYVLIKVLLYFSEAVKVNPVRKHNKYKHNIKAYNRSMGKYNKV